MGRKILILTEGLSSPNSAKTACSVIRYRREEVLAVLDSTRAGEDCNGALGVPPGVSFIASLDEAPGANTLLIGIAPPGGKIPDAWRKIVLLAIERGMDVVSGLHDFISEDEQFSSAARHQDVQLVDVRKTDLTTIARRPGFREGCFRVHTVGHDCSVGKMVSAIEITNGLKARGHDAKFLATGQTGIMVEGDGYPMDRVIADFVSGATERLVLENEQHDILVVEGQGSLVHPSYSAVTLGILHGALPHALVLCFEVGREGITGVEHVAIPSLARIIEINEMMAGLCHPCPVVAV
ncbi:MAG: DUF1611 domain-containing protein, partial [Pirellulaceae bacterium]|nr:DUF1611 domain-containing protein [Pirellulaceae bacterium]